MNQSVYFVSNCNISGIQDSRFWEKLFESQSKIQGSRFWEKLSEILIQDSRFWFFFESRLPSSRFKAWDSKSVSQNLESWSLNPKNIANFPEFLWILDFKFKMNLYQIILTFTGLSKILNHYNIYIDIDI